MLERAVASVKENKGRALALFNKGEDSFKDRDLYVFCASASDGVLGGDRPLEKHTFYTKVLDQNCGVGYCK